MALLVSFMCKKSNPHTPKNITHNDTHIYSYKLFRGHWNYKFRGLHVGFWQSLSVPYIWQYHFWLGKSITNTEISPFSRFCSSLQICSFNLFTLWSVLLKRWFYVLFSINSNTIIIDKLAEHSQIWSIVLQMSLQLFVKIIIYSRNIDYIMSSLVSFNLEHLSLFPMISILTCLSYDL